ncbi:hypothetical protein PV326_011962 [Microctonus aethiopoides]|nr:hypothetical protein PV326_011962 [Microctonus aethiopoides]
MSPKASNKYLHPVSNGSRNDFVVLDCSNSEEKNKSLNKKTWSAKLNEIYDRLFTHHTHNSIRRGYHYVNEDMVPNDSLDFALSSIYIHSDDYNVPKNYVPMQPDTLNIPTWIVHQHEFRDITSLLSITTKEMSKQGNQTGPIKKQVNEPKISMGTSSLALKKSTNKNEKTFPIAKTVFTPKRGLGKTTPRDQYGNITSRKQYEKSSSSKRALLSSNKKYSKTALTSTTRGPGQSSARNKNTKDERGEKSSVRSYRATGNVAKDKVAGKTQRHESYAAQMRAIERIHPSSLKLAIDGPHSDQTNPGYSRKIDGTFYGI